MNNQRISAAGSDLIEEFEDNKLTAYPDPGTGGAPWTIGRGHTGPEVVEGLTITEAVSDQLFAQDLHERAEVLVNSLNLKLTQNQFDAMCSLLFNVGPGVKNKRDGIIVLANGKPSTLLRMLQQGDYRGAADQFLAWNRSGGRVMNGLVRRRTAERSLFLTGM